MKESDLYPSLKQYLESQGYEIKGEVANCDVVAIREDEEPLIVELKLSLNLTVVLQAVDRLKLSSTVYIGIPHTCSALKRKYKQISKMLKMLGLGLITINPAKETGAVKVLFDPAEYTPRVSKHRKTRLLGEFEKRVGDPNAGGTETKKGIITAYRQNAVKVAAFLQAHGSGKASDIAQQTGVTEARNIMYRDVYGWFDNVSRGVYQLSPRGIREIPDWLKTLAESNTPDSIISDTKNSS